MRKGRSRRATPARALNHRRFKEPIKRDRTRDTARFFLRGVVAARGEGTSIQPRKSLVILLRVVIASLSITDRACREFSIDSLATKSAIIPRIEGRSGRSWSGNRVSGRDAISAMQSLSLRFRFLFRSSEASCEATTFPCEMRFPRDYSSSLARPRRAMTLNPLRTRVCIIHVMASDMHIHAPSWGEGVEVHAFKKLFLQMKKATLDRRWDIGIVVMLIDVRIDIQSLRWLQWRTILMARYLSRIFRHRIFLDKIRQCTRETNGAMWLRGNNVSLASMSGNLLRNA